MQMRKSIYDRRGGRKASKNLDKPRTRKAMSKQSAGTSWKKPCTTALTRLKAPDIRIEKAPRGHLRIEIASRNAAGLNEVEEGRRA